MTSERTTGIPPAPRTDELRRRLSEVAVGPGIKPPLGVIPRIIWEDRRLAELDRAMMEYDAFGFPVDPEWPRERDELLAWRSTRPPTTIAEMLAGRRAGKATAGVEAAAAAIDELVRRSRILGFGILLVGSSRDNALLAYVDERIPEGQIINHPDPLPEGGVEALLAGLYPSAGPRSNGDVWASHGHPDSPCSPPEAVHGDVPCRRV